MEQWMEALSLILKIFTVYTTIAPPAEDPPGSGQNPVCRPAGGAE